MNGAVKGWCPSAFRPMMSRDGLVVRVRPFYGALSGDQALALAHLAQRFGNGMIDLTSRANLQIRGVKEAGQAALLQELQALDLLSPDPEVEARRNILMPSDWQSEDITHRLSQALVAHLPSLPLLPEKMGYAVDSGARGQLADGSADFRFEISEVGGLILRADGAALGMDVDEADATDALSEMVAWFVQSGGPEAGRMARHLRQAALPGRFQTTPPRRADASPKIGAQDTGGVLAVAFGQIDAGEWHALLTQTRAKELRLLLDRKIWLAADAPLSAKGFITSEGDPLLHTHACPGAPYCPQSSVDTRALARRLAPRSAKPLHVSGCSKGCALPKTAAITLVGRDGAFDLVHNGAPWDEARQTGLSPQQAQQLQEFE